LLADRAGGKRGQCWLRRLPHVNAVCFAHTALCVPAARLHLLVLVDQSDPREIRAEQQQEFCAGRDCFLLFLLLLDLLLFFFGVVVRAVVIVPAVPALRLAPC
jgi:hypothetical protein